MNVPVTLPALGEAIESASVSAWLKAIGDTVEEGEPLVEVSTDKVDTEIESPAAGVLIDILVADDGVAGVGDVLGTIASAAGVTVASAPEPEPEPEPIAAPAIDETADRSPVDAAPSSTDDGLRGTTQKLTRLRRTIAHRMLESLQTSAQLTTIVEVDVTEVGSRRRRHNDALVTGRGVRLSYLPFIARAALDALQTYPQVNSTVDLEAGTVTYPAAEHLGIAVDTDRGLFVPVVRDAGSLTVTELAVRIADLADRTRSSTITVDELTGGTFTITNTGSRGALMDTPIINQPQVAILGAGVVTRRPVIVGRQGQDESIAVRSMMYLSLTYDHRVVDGADAARFLSAVKHSLEQPDADLG